jgi:hypothetical protein
MLQHRKEVSSGPMSTQIKQVDQKVLVLSHSSPLTTLATLFNNTMATIGTVEPLRSVKIGTLAVGQAWVVASVAAAAVMEAVSACVVVSVVAEEDSAGVEDSEVVAMDAVDMEVATVVPVVPVVPAVLAVLAVGEEDTVAAVLLRSQSRPILSPTTPPMEVNGVRSSSSET